MSQTYAFLFCLGLGIAARFLYILTTKLARRTDILPVTVVLDFLTAAAVGGALTVYVIMTATVLAPYMFVALFAGYLLTYLLTKRGGKTSSGESPRKSRKQKKQHDKA